MTIASAYGDEVGVENDNLRSALGWCLETDPLSGLGIARLIWLFWIFRGQATEGRKWLEELLEQAPERTIDRALALIGAGQLAEDQGDLDRAESAAEESVSILRENGDQLDISWALIRLGTAALEKGDFRRARTLLEESLALCRRNGDLHSEYRSLTSLARIAWLNGDSDRTLRLYEEARLVAGSLEAFRSPPGWISGNVGRAWISRGDYARARRLLDESVSEFRRLGRYDCLGWSLPDLGQVLARQGEHDRAEALLRESLSLLRAQGHRSRTCRALYISGLLANGRGDYERGCRLIAVATMRHPMAETLLDPTERAEVEAGLAAARAALGEEAFAKAWAEGQAMTLEQAVEYALEDKEEA